MFEVLKAKREAAPHLIAIAGQTGAGKTYSALLMARGMVGDQGKIVLIDTEGKRGLIYADDDAIGGYDHIDFVAPWSSDRFREALRAAIAAGADAIVIDSASHEHEAEGGMLDFADQEEKRMRNNRRANAKWIKPKMAHGRFMTAVKSAPVHIIFCVREKVIIDVDSKPAREVFVPVCDRDFLFEMGLSLRLEPGTHKATYTKVPKPFAPYITEGEMVTREHGALLVKAAGVGEGRDNKALAVISNLEQAAELGEQTLRNAWEAAWRANGPEGDTKAMTPIRIEMQKHLQRIKRIAAEAEENNDQPALEPGELGEIETIEDPEQEEPMA